MNVELNLPTSLSDMSFGESDVKTETVETPLTLGQVEESVEIQEELVEPEEAIENVYYNTAQNFVTKGLINLEDLDEEDYNFEDWNEKSFQGFFEKVLESKSKKETEAANAASEETFNYILENMSDITRKGFEFEKNNPEPDKVKSFYQQLVFEADIKTLNPADSIDAERILEEYYKSQGETLEDARERISNLKDPIAEANKVKPKLDKKVEEIALAKIEEQNQILAFDLEAKKQVTSRVEKIFEKTSLDGIPLTKEVKSFLKQVLIDDEVPIIIKGKPVTVSGAEALIRLHKFDSERGNLEHLMKTIIYLQAPELFEKTIFKKVEERETNRKIKEHKESSATKSGVSQQLFKPKTEFKKPGMVFSTT